MPNHRRNRVEGGCYFFTVNLQDRQSDLLVTEIEALRSAVRSARAKYPCHIDAWEVLPNHMHCLWTLPPDDFDFPARWQMIKAMFARGAAGGRAARLADPQARKRHLAAPVLGAHSSR
jgi:putative transposase